MIAIISLIFFIYRLSSHKFEGYWKYHDFDRNIAEKYGIYSLCIEGKKYTWFHKIGIILSLIGIVCSFCDSAQLYGRIIISLYWICGFTFSFLYPLKFEKMIREAKANEFHCIHLLNSYIYVTTEGKYSWNHRWKYEDNVDAKDADAIEELYLCCRFDRDMLIWDAIALGLFALSLIFIVPI